MIPQQRQDPRGSTSLRILTDEPTKMSDDEPIDFMEETVDFIKSTLTNEKRKQARIIKSIQVLIGDNSSRTALNGLRQQLVSSEDELTHLNIALAAELPEENVAEYQAELDARVAVCYKLIDDYHQARVGDAYSIATARSQFSNSRTSEISSSSSRRLQEATNRRELAELELVQTKRAVEQQQTLRVAVENVERLQLEEQQAARDVPAQDEISEDEVDENQENDMEDETIRPQNPGHFDNIVPDPIPCLPLEDARTQQMQIGHRVNSTPTNPPPTSAGSSELPKPTPILSLVAVIAAANVAPKQRIISLSPGEGR